MIIFMKLHPIFENKKLVLLDFDGTLVDSMSMWVDIDRQIFAASGLPVPDGLTERLIPLNEDETAAVFLEYGCQGTVESIRAMHDRLAQEQYEKFISLKPGAKELLDALREKDIKLGIVSAATLGRMLPCIARLGLTGYFSIILPCGDIGINKHTAEPYQMALETLNVDAEHAVFVDDFYGNINGASMAGLSTIGVYDSVGDANWPQMQQSADLCVLSLEDIL
jgi:HAD superfamily hydrolase (TIGR01509 family)